MTSQTKPRNLSCNLQQVTVCFVTCHK